MHMEKFYPNTLFQPNFYKVLPKHFVSVEKTSKNYICVKVKVLGL